MLGIFMLQFTTTCAIVCICLKIYQVCSNSNLFNLNRRRRRRNQNPGDIYIRICEYVGTLMFKVIRDILISIFVPYREDGLGGFYLLRNSILISLFLLKMSFPWSFDKLRVGKFEVERVFGH